MKGEIQMERKKLLYAIPTMHCNLNCPHCFIKETPEVYDRDKFLEVLNNFDGEMLLFGGEVTTHLDRMFDIIEDNRLNGKSKINHISTNLIIINDELINFYKSIDGLSTSWNPHRFNGNEYDVWLSNCKTISDNDISYTLMITLTNDLFELSADDFISIASEWAGIQGLNVIKFEHYVGDVNPEYFARADKWLSDLYVRWNLPITVETFDRVKYWYNDCNQIYTLYPDGKLINMCPHAQPGVVPSECYTCEKVAKCRPCRLQPYCSYPKELSKLVYEREGLEG